jgi:23S rRNA U2552 (ribose-2'-O)-methylase RlmE/FtsJ
MVKGHLDQARINQNSTKTYNEPADPTDHFPNVLGTDNFPDVLMDERSHFYYAVLMELTGQVYSDQTGKFTQPSSNGNNYLLILYDCDSDLIMAEPMKTRSAQSILDAYKTVHTKLCQSRFKPQLQHLNNECSTALKEFMKDENLDYHSHIQEPLHCWTLQC